ncbi:NADH:ubiquinone oxidoreductase complex I intermediate-associated protein 30 [Durotheca rogersii]|uniref:NADH:ubiquinone oxidoreductase complex I intermediate-associated protein 30 n=1 Tax=Durotheca rogersii TaxID=419775 RepID=UPI00221EBAC9|nr:NADH:ubiquinone oxidoreductase complex I intermediate-associated protein 30 [Durotheca rogersii]KAI5861348.1 NADH:ubiquinone oxidoreductase complex I intermediate-associated protein 30 [Durotheca rogersii]
MASEVLPPPADDISLLYLFGGDKPWHVHDWTASDDRVRGGKSQSYLDLPAPDLASFHGHLDITALGGAGFASRRSVDPRSWDLSRCQGLRIRVAENDGKRYTLVLKDEVPPRRPDGREQSTVSWEYDFILPDAEACVDILWGDFKPTYRGRQERDAKPLRLENIRRISLMMRSFFGQQHGPFRLGLQYIAAVKSDNNSDPR